MEISVPLPVVDPTQPKSAEPKIEVDQPKVDIKPTPSVDKLILTADPTYNSIKGGYFDRCRNGRPVEVLITAWETVVQGSQMIQANPRRRMFAVIADGNNTVRFSPNQEHSTNGHGIMNGDNAPGHCVLDECQWGDVIHQAWFWSIAHLPPGLILVIEEIYLS